MKTINVVSYVSGGRETEPIENGYVPRVGEWVSIFGVDFNTPVALLVARVTWTVERRVSQTRTWAMVHLE